VYFIPFFPFSAAADSASLDIYNIHKEYIRVNIFLKKFHFFLAYSKLQNLESCRARGGWALDIYFFWESVPRTPTAALRPLFKAFLMPGASVGESRGMVRKMGVSALYKGASRKAQQMGFATN
jgi:hypothetical protein